MMSCKRPYFLKAGMLILGTGVALTSAVAAQEHPFALIFRSMRPLLAGHNNSQGYLGVDLADIDSEKAQAFRLKEVRGAQITLIDHDAPAGQVGLRVNDVVLKLNGQKVEGAEQLRRMLHELPAGRKIEMEISRDGSLQKVHVQLADRRAMEQEIWNRLGRNGSQEDSSGGPAMGMLANGDVSGSGGFHMPSLFGSELNVGALVEPLTEQMADYLEITNGLMVKQVAHKSEAAMAGMRAHDIILKVGSEPINTISDWDRALRSNQGKSVPVTILREKKQQILNLQVDSHHHHGE